jgi:hypothetical protein
MPGGIIKGAAVTVAAVDNAASVTGIPSVAHVAVQIVGSMSATITFETTVDGTNWVATTLLPAASTTGVSTATAAGLWGGNIGAVAGFRARCSAYTSGSPVVTVRVATL